MLTQRPPESCVQIERAWQTCLDARPPRRLTWVEEPPWSDHVAQCPRCQATTRRFKTLQTALAQHPWDAGPVPDMTDSVVDAWQASPHGPVGYQGPRVLRYIPVGLLTAAAALWLTIVGPWARHAPIVPHQDVEAPRAAAIPRPLADSLSDVTTATLRLAFDTSKPAARVGQHLLASAAGVRTPEPPGHVPSPERLVWDLGDRVVSGVKPISESARKAFGRLLPGTLAQTNGPTN